MGKAKHASVQVMLNHFFWAPAGLVRAIDALLAEAPQERRGWPRQRGSAAQRGGVSLRGHADEGSDSISRHVV